MAFGTGKDTGLNNSTRREMEGLVKRGYTPQEISDHLQVRLPCILSFYKSMSGKTDEQMKEYSTVDGSEDVLGDAAIEARKIVEAAHVEAEKIKQAALDEAAAPVKPAGKPTKV